MTSSGDCWHEALYSLGQQEGSNQLLINYIYTYNEFDFVK